MQLISIEDQTNQQTNLVEVVVRFNKISTQGEDLGPSDALAHYLHQCVDTWLNTQCAKVEHYEEPTTCLH